MNTKRILFISDLHAPYMHQDAARFLRAVKKKYAPTAVILSGDEVDWHSISMHEHDPNLPGPFDELQLAIKQLQPIYDMFPKAHVLESNHGSLVFRRAKLAGLPDAVFKTYQQMLQAPKGWTWHFDLRLKLPTGEMCYFHHSKGANVKKNSQAYGMSFCQGHHHETFEVTYWGNPMGLHFGVTTGCLVDPKSLALAYGKNNLKRPVLGVTVILDGVPKLLPMILNHKSRWTGVVP